VIKKAKEVMGEILSDREKSYDQGRINLQKVLEARSNVASMESKYIEAAESYTSGIEALLFYTGLETKELTLTTGFRTTLPGIDEEEVKTRTLHNSRDLTIMQKKLDQAITYLNIEKGSDLFRPDFSFIISFDISGGKIPFIDADWNDSWDHNITFTLGTEVKLFDGGKSGLKIKEAKNTRHMAETGLKQMEKGLVLSIRKGIQEVRVKYYAAREKEAKFEEIKEQYKNAKVSYDNDLITRSEERGARILLFTAELEYVWAKYEYETALGELEFLSGMEF
ncbi:MAG: TolC family protein, partial [Spirochaetales bacterium]|nr:TolC family protein [Spirochaetales bacterium]